MMTTNWRFHQQCSEKFFDVTFSPMHTFISFLRRYHRCKYRGCRVATLCERNFIFCHAKKHGLRIAQYIEMK